MLNGAFTDKIKLKSKMCGINDNVKNTFTDPCTY